MVECPAVQDAISVIGPASIDMMDTMSKMITQGYHLGVKRYQVVHWSTVSCLLKSVH